MPGALSLSLRLIHLLAPIALLGPAGVSAQAISEQVDSGFVRGAPSVSRGDATTACVLPLGEPFELEVRVTGCEVAEVVDAEEGWVLVHYRRPALVTEPPETPTWVDQVVLFAVEGDTGELSPRWRYEVERTFSFVSGLAAVRRPEGVVLELLACLNGTGGCLREYLLLRPGRLDVVAQPFVAEMQALLPAGLHLHKGMTLDLATLSGVWPVAAPEDPNCCPSRELAFEVRFVGTALELVSSRLSPPGHAGVLRDQRPPVSNLSVSTASASVRPATRCSRKSAVGSSPGPSSRPRRVSTPAETPTVP
jgi:hypothetical protein